MNPLRARLIRHSLAQFVRTDVVTALGAIVFALVVWEIIGVFVVTRWLPRVTAVLANVGSLLADGNFVTVLLSSLGETLLGFVIGTAVGTAAGVAMVRSDRANQALRIYVLALLTLPSVVLAPILLVIFGVSQVNIVVLVVIFVIGLVAITTTAAIRSMDRSLIDMGLAYGCRGMRLTATIVLPFVLPAFMSGIHLGMSRAFKGMIVGQTFIGVIGVGAYEAHYEDAFNAVGMWSIALILIGLALIFVWIVRGLDHVLNFWAYQ